MRNLSGACQLQEKFGCGHMHSKRWARCTEKLTSEISQRVGPKTFACTSDGSHRKASPLIIQTAPAIIVNGCQDPRIDGDKLGRPCW